MCQIYKVRIWTEYVNWKKLLCKINNRICFIYIRSLKKQNSEAAVPVPQNRFSSPVRYTIIILRRPHWGKRHNTRDRLFFHYPSYRLKQSTNNLCCPDGGISPPRTEYSAAEARLMVFLYSYYPFYHLPELSCPQGMKKYMIFPMLRKET